MSRTRKHKIVEAVMAEETEGRRNRAFAIACAAVCFRGNAITEAHTFFTLADEFLDYIEGNDCAPKPDKLMKGIGR